LRVGCWLWTPRQYSGGRLLVYQYAINLARAGVEVFFITNAVPLWHRDYPASPNLTFLIDGKDTIPPDLDVLMTDSKGPLGLQAKAYKTAHPWSKLVCLNFETANWVEKYVPRVANIMSKTHIHEGYSASDLLLGISPLSLKYLMEWMGETADMRRYDYLPPAINTYALNADIVPEWPRPEHPYALWSARNTDYKCSNTVFKAIWSLKRPFDLVTFGDPGGDVPADTPEHKWYSCKNFPDSVKYDAMRGAHVVLAPSLFEGFGMVPAEALASGTPVIAYDLPVLRWVYGKRLNYVAWNDENSFVRKVKKLVSAPKQDMRKSKRYVLDSYSMKAMAKRVEALPFHSFKTKHVAACMICYGTKTAPAAVEAVYPHVSEILIGYGPTRLYAGASENGVLDALRAWKAAHDTEGKVRIIARDLWRDKQEMRQTLADNITGNYQLVLDADEIWTGLDAFLASDVAFGTPRWVNLWHDDAHWIHDAVSAGGRRWGSSVGVGSVCPLYRFSWWRQSYYWRRHHTPSDRRDQPLHDYENNVSAAEKVPECVIYHLGHCLTAETMRVKHGFYESRDRAPQNRSDAWHGWNGLPGECGDGFVQEVTWQLPEIVKKAFSLV